MGLTHTCFPFFTSIASAGACFDRTVPRTTIFFAWTISTSPDWGSMRARKWLSTVSTLFHLSSRAEYSIVLCADECSAISEGWGWLALFRRFAVGSSSLS